MEKFDEVLAKRRQEVRQQRNRTLEMQRKRMKREKRKDTILSILIGGFIMIVTCLLINEYGKSFNKDIKNCMNNGYSKNYCIEHL